MRQNYKPFIVALFIIFVVFRTNAQQQQEQQQTERTKIIILLLIRSVLREAYNQNPGATIRSRKSKFKNLEANNFVNVAFDPYMQKTTRGQPSC